MSSKTMRQRLFEQFGKAQHGEVIRDQLLWIMIALALCESITGWSHKEETPNAD